MRLVFATHNPGKIPEMQAILAGLPLTVCSADDAGVHEDVVEDGQTFAENALKKARFVAKQSGEWAVADDSGLCIAALDGKPGVYSARWAGESVSGDALIAYTLAALKTVPEGKRQAWFESCAALVAPDGREWTFSGKITGIIPLTPRGTPRPKLPYDTIFIPDGHGRTFAEMSDTEKNSLSHRGQAFGELRKFLQEIFEKA
ncbi:MAG: RdgB/HAM1 family non-canonical purine NTP pyrophosphatase [Patescibacteria group bacterium]|jgi:XTP/dITP diphosphohydrolase